MIRKISSSTLILLLLLGAGASGMARHPSCTAPCCCTEMAGDRNHRGDQAPDPGFAPCSCAIEDNCDLSASLPRLPEGAVAGSEAPPAGQGFAQWEATEVPDASGIRMRSDFPIVFPPRSTPIFLEILTLIC